jgi:hypothetical protein
VEWRTPAEGVGSVADFGWYELFHARGVLAARLAEGDVRTFEAQRQAYAGVYAAVQAQAYVDTYWFLAAAVALMFGLSFGLRKNDPRARGHVAAH